MAIGDLPQSAMLSILMSLDYKTITKMKTVSKRWLEVVLGNQDFWGRKFERDYGLLDMDHMDYEKEYRREFGWRECEPKVSYFIARREIVNDVKVLGSMIACSSEDGGLFMWNLDTMQCEHEFHARSRVSSVAFDNEKVLIGMGNGEIHVWSFASRSFCYSWRAHHDEVRPLFISNGFLISGAFFGSLKIWNASSFECLHTFEVGYGSNKLVHVDQKEVFYCSRKGNQVHVFHQDEGSMYILETRCIVYSICANPKHIFVGCSDGNIQVWDRGTKKQVAMLHGSRHNDCIMGLWCDGMKLISMSCWGHLKIWDARNWTPIKSVNLHVRVWRTHHEGGKVVIGCSYGRVRVLDFHW